ncbi:MAG: hypothetical protein WDN49_25270 [Acetobacteraceae bacterium]
MKWYFELLKNAVLVAAIVYFANRTKSASLGHIAVISKIVFSLYCLTYLFSWKGWLYRNKTPRQRALLGAILVPLLGAAIFFVFSKSLNVVMHDLVRAQSR